MFGLVVIEVMTPSEHLSNINEILKNLWTKYNSSSNCLYKITKYEKHSYTFHFIHILCICFQFSFHFQKEVCTYSFKDEWEKN